MNTGWIIEDRSRVSLTSPDDFRIYTAEEPHKLFYAAEGDKAKRIEITIEFSGARD